MSINGELPPSRVGLRTGTGRATARSGESPVEALLGTLIKKMRAKFSEVASDVKSQEVIAQECKEFMLKTASMRDEDLFKLEDKIRSRLSGETPVRNSLAAEKRAQVAGDEWARIYKFHVAEGAEKDKQRQEWQREKQRQQRAVLAAQLQELDQQKKKEAEVEHTYFVAEQAQLKQWEEEENMRKSQQMSVRMQLNTDRAEQLQDRTTRRTMAQEKQKKEDEALAARIAYETRVELEKEEQERVRAKMALKDFLQQNEENKRIREETKQQQWKLDKHYMEQYAAMLDKQERERQERLEKMRAVQAKQADMASTMKPYKQWIDPALIEKYFQEREEALDKEQAKRQAALKSKTKEMIASLDVQVKEREKARAELRQIEQLRAKELLERVKKGEEEEKARKARLAENKIKFRDQLETQLKDNAQRRRVAPMSETEKLINAQLLKRVDVFQNTGEIRASV